MSQIEIRKIQRGDRLQPALAELELGMSLKIPYRFYSENSIRATLSQLKLDRAMRFKANTASHIAAIVTRVE